MDSALFGEKQYAKSEQIYSKTIAVNPNMWGAHSSVAEVYSAEERWPEFDRERKLLREARDRGEPGTNKTGSDVIDVLYVDGERYIVREFHLLDGRVHTRYRFMHFDGCYRLCKLRPDCERAHHCGRVGWQDADTEMLEGSPSQPAIAESSEADSAR